MSVSLSGGTMLATRLHDSLLLIGILLVAAGVVFARAAQGIWSTIGLFVGLAGAVLLVAGIVKKTMAGR